MSAVRMSRLWLIGGVLLGLALIAATYVAVVSPARSQVASVRSQVDDASTQQTVLRHRLHELEAAAQATGALDAQLAAVATALPPSVDTQGVLRRVQAVAHAAGVVVDDVSFGPAEASGVVGVSAQPVGIELLGSPEGLVTAVSRLQSDGSRLMTVGTSSLKQQEGSGFKLSLTAKVYSTGAPSAAHAATGAVGATAGTGGAGAATTGGGAAAAGAPTAS